MFSNKRVYYVIDVFPLPRSSNRHVLREIKELSLETSTLYLNKSCELVLVPQDAVQGLHFPLVTGVTQNQYLQENKHLILNSNWVVPMVQEQEEGRWTLDFNLETVRSVTLAKYKEQVNREILSVLPEWKQSTLNFDKEVAASRIYGWTQRDFHSLLSDIVKEMKLTEGKLRTYQYFPNFTHMDPLVQRYSRLALALVKAPVQAHPAPPSELHKDVMAIGRWYLANRWIQDFRTTLDRAETEILKTQTVEEAFHFHVPLPEL